MKGSLSTHHPIEGDELRIIKRYLAKRDDDLPWLFITERGGQMTRKGIYILVARIAERAGLENVHPHTLRHSCGYYLANRRTSERVMQDYLGHRNPRHTMRYTRVASSNFDGLWSKRGR
jgi:site-specific recombinase XerD